MKHHLNLVALLCGMMMLAIPMEGYTISTMSIQFENTLRLISLDMPRKEVIETLGTPDIIKSEGMCLQYESMGLSIFMNQNDQVEQIYLAKNFKGTVGNKQPSKGIQLADIEKEFGPSVETSILNYQPSLIIQTKATVETENNTDPGGKEKGDFPLQYSGERKLYIFLNGGKPMKYKYVLDEEGIAFWLDHNKQLYATALYTSPRRNAIVHLPVAEKEKVIDKIHLPVVHFDFDKYNIKNLYVPDLDQHISFLRANPSSPVIVEGHTDSKGSDQYNKKLSERRANAVRKYLIERGISSSQVHVIGYGEQRPITDNTSTEGRAINRRTEFEVTIEK